jgi:YD repeat-containing protein
MIDPYGQVTTITNEVYGTDHGDPQYRISRVTEPGGRYLQIRWSGPFGNFGDPPEGFISQVDAYDGVNSQAIQSVIYHYANYTPPGGSNTFTVLDHVDYTDQTHAYYTYAKPGNITLNSADDVRYTASAMRQIEYHFTNNKLTSESNFTTHETVTSLTWQDNVNQTDIRTETRGDSPNPSGTPIARTFTYYRVQKDPEGNCLNPGSGGKLKSYTDFLGNTTTLTYNGDNGYDGGFITSVTDPNGRVTQYIRGDSTYPSPNLKPWAIYQIIYPDGSSIEQTFTDDQNPYYLASRTLQHGPSDPPYPIVYTRDANHRITRKDYPDGSFETFSYNPLGEVLTHRMTSGGTETFVYDTRGLKTSYTDATQGTTIYTYYTSGPWTDRLQTVTHPANASGFQATETYEYDRTPDSNLNQSGPVHGVGTVTSPIGGRGLVTKISHADGSYQSFSYNKYGDKLWEEDELGHRTSYTYDDYGRVLTTTTSPRFTGDTQNHTTTNSYVPTGKTSSEIATSKLPFSTTLPSGKQTTFEYDNNWRKTFVHQAPNTSDAATTQYVYDTGGSPNIGHLMSMIDPRNNATTYGYDNRDRQTSVTDALSHMNIVHYNLRGQKDYEIKPNTPTGMHAIDYDEYDPMNRLLHKKVLRDASTTPATIDQVSMTYDDAGNLSSNTDENGNIYNYTYDFMNRPMSMVYPNGLTEVHNYDAAGNVETYKNRTGALQFFAYDNRNRQTAFSWDDGTSPQTTAYDAASRKTQILNDDATINFLYYNDNTLKSQEEWATALNDNVHRTVTYTYDPDGNRATIQYPSGQAFNYGYTNRNQVASIKPGLSGGTAIVSYTFDPSGNITNRSLDNGTSTAYTVDQVNRDSAVAHTLVPNTVIKRFDYAYNAVNDVTAVEPDGNTNDGDGYLYDLTQQITGYQQHGTVNLAAGTVTSPQTNTTLTFDGCGNQRSKNGVAFTPPNNMNQPTDPGITYDLNGNLLTYGNYVYKYDAQNRLRTVLNESNLKIAEFFYDGLNRQVARSIITVNLPSLPSTINTFSVWDGDWAILEEYGANNVLTQKYLQGYHGLVKTFVGTAAYYYQDELGSTSHIAGSTGSLLDYYKYDLYGKPKFFDALNNQLSTTSYSFSRS